LRPRYLLRRSRRSTPNAVKLAVPAIGRDLHAGVDTMQWVVTTYLLTTAALLLVAGNLADRFGPKRILIVGLGVALVASILCSLAPSIEALIVARIFQGIGGALITPTAIAMLGSTLRMSDRAQAIGIWVGLGTVAISLGPYAGGWVVDHVSWRAPFLLSLPLITVCLLALAHVPEKSDTRRMRSLDVVGGTLAVIGLGALIYVLTEGSASGWMNAPVLVTGAIGAAALAALVPVEQRLRDPMLRLSLFASRQFDAINLTTLLFYGALAAAGYLLVLELQLHLGYSAAEAGQR
jgi:EmrB/QacA subfamily drug resistance transporter